jgi:hypothetical protein
MFLSHYCGYRLVDAHVGILELLRQSPLPWRRIEGSSLCDLNESQFFLAWAWHQNSEARHCLDGKALAQGCTPEEAQECGMVAAISAVKSLSHAKLLMTLGAAGKAQDSA